MRHPQCLRLPGHSKSFNGNFLRLIVTTEHVRKPTKSCGANLLWDSNILNEYAWRKLMASMSKIDEKSNDLAPMFMDWHIVQPL
jgi:hypothetical protein